MHKFPMRRKSLHKACVTFAQHKGSRPKMRLHQSFENYIVQENYSMGSYGKLSFANDCTPVSTKPDHSFYLLTFFSPVTGLRNNDEHQLP